VNKDFDLVNDTGIFLIDGLGNRWKSSMQDLLGKIFTPEHALHSRSENS
jgi:hypothetical protein